MTLNVAVVGLGKQSLKHARALEAAGCTLKVGIDREDQACTEFSQLFGAKVFHDVSTHSCGLFSEIELAVICTPVFARQKVVRQLVDEGVKLFVIEKPLALNKADCNFYVSLEKQHGVKVYVNYTYRLTPPFYQVKQATTIEPDLFSFGRFYLGAPGNHKKWKHLVESGGGAYNELGVHMQDLANYLLGRPSIASKRFECCMKTSREFDGIVHKVDAPDLYTQAFVHPNATSLVMADFLSQRFSNSVFLDSGRMSLQLEIGKVSMQLNEAFPNIQDIDEFGDNSYQRLYELVLRDDPNGLLHRPVDTLNLLSI